MYQGLFLVYNTLFHLFNEAIMFLSKEKIQFKIQEYIDDKKAQNLPWDTLEYDYLLKDLHADIWDYKGDKIDEDENIETNPLPILNLENVVVSKNNNAEEEFKDPMDELHIPNSQWKPMSTFPTDGTQKIIKTTTGIVGAWYCPEEDTTGYFELPGEGYVPPCLVCYDDEFQIYAENQGDGNYFPGVIGWIDIPD